MSRLPKKQLLLQTINLSIKHTPNRHFLFNQLLDLNVSFLYIIFQLTNLLLKSVHLSLELMLQLVNLIVMSWIEFDLQIIHFHT